MGWKLDKNKNTSTKQHNAKVIYGPVQAVNISQYNPKATIILSNSMIDQGQSILFTARISSGLSPYTYNYTVIEYNTLTSSNQIMANNLLSNSYTSNSWLWTPPGNLYIGNSIFEANVIITDSHPRVANSIYNGFGYNSVLANPSVPKFGSSVTQGQRATITIYVSGGTGPYTYNFLVFSAASKVVVANMITSSNSFSFLTNSVWASNSPLEGNVTLWDSATTNTYITSSNSSNFVVNSISRSSNIYGTINADGLINTEVGRYDQEVDYRFSSSYSGAINSILIFVKADAPGYYNGNGGEMQIELETDDNSSSHLPSGNIIAYSNVISNLLSPSPFNRSLSFPMQPALVKGAIYHLVFVNPTGDPLNNWSSIDGIYNIIGKPNIQPGINDIDQAELVINNVNTSWRVKYTVTPIFSLAFENGSTQGLGYIDAKVHSNFSINGTNQVRETFTVNRSNKGVSGFAVRVFKQGSPGNLTITLENQNGTLIEQGMIPATYLGANYVWVSYNFTKNRTLLVGHSYNLVVNAIAGNGYLIYPIQKGTTYGWKYPTVFTDGYYQTNNGLGWTDFMGTRTDFDMQFYFNLTSTTTTTSTSTSTSTIGPGQIIQSSGENYGNKQQNSQLAPSITPYKSGNQTGFVISNLTQGINETVYLSNNTKRVNLIVNSINATNAVVTINNQTFNLNIGLPVAFIDPENYTYYVELKNISYLSSTHAITLFVYAQKNFLVSSSTTTSTISLHTTLPTTTTTIQAIPPVKQEGYDYNLIYAIIIIIVVVIVLFVIYALGRRRK